MERRQVACHLMLERRRSVEAAAAPVVEGSVLMEKKAMLRQVAAAHWESVVEEGVEM